MKRLIFLLLLGSAFAQTSITASKINGSCVALGGTITQALTCAGTSGVIEIPASGGVTLTANTTIPAGVTLKFSGTCITTTGFTLTINGPIVAPDNAQLFCGTGAVVGLSTIHPEWFGANAISTAVQSAFASTGGTLVLGNKTYTSGFYQGTCWTQSNVWFKGSGQPTANSTQTALQNGTIIQGGFAAAGANNLRFTDLGIDDGSAFAGTSTNDGLAVTGTTGCSSSSPSDALVTGTYISNVTSILSGGAVAFHAIRLEHNSYPVVRNATSYFGTHGLTIKSPGASVVGHTAYGEGTDGIIIKADTYTPVVNNVTLTDTKSSTINSSNVLLAGVVIDAENAGQVTGVNISQLQVTNASQAIELISNGTFGPCAISNVNISNVTYLINTAYGLAASYGLLSEGSGSQTGCLIHTHGLNLQSTVGSVPFFPFGLILPLNNSTFEDTATDGSNSTGSTFTGTGIMITNLTETNATSSRPFVVTGGSSVTFTGEYSGATPLSSVTNNGTFNFDASAGPTLGHTNSASLYYGLQLVTVSALSTATVLPGSGSQSGILRIRDNTSGGAAVFLIDPNGGATLISSQITGLAVSGDITFASGQWKVTLTSGSTPRTLAWTIYD